MMKEHVLLYLIIGQCWFLYLFNEATARAMRGDSTVVRTIVVLLLIVGWPLSFYKAFRGRS